MSVGEVFFSYHSCVAPYIGANYFTVTPINKSEHIKKTSLILHEVFFLQAKISTKRIFVVIFNFDKVVVFLR